MENPAFKNSGENQENDTEAPEIPSRSSSSSSSSSSDESTSKKDPGLSADPRYNQFFWLGLFCPCPAAYILSRELNEGGSCMRHLFPLIAGLIFAIALVATGAAYASDPYLDLGTSKFSYQWFMLISHAMACRNPTSLFVHQFIFCSEMGLIVTGCITGLCILVFCLMLYLLRLHVSTNTIYFIVSLVFC